MPMQSGIDPCPCPGRAGAATIVATWERVHRLLDGDLDVAALLDAPPGCTGWLTLELWHPETMTPQRSMIEDTRRSADFLQELAAR